jgi:hypothetical protein
MCLLSDMAVGAAAKEVMELSCEGRAAALGRAGHVRGRVGTARHGGGDGGSVGCGVCSEWWRGFEAEERVRGGVSGAEWDGVEWRRQDGRGGGDM